MARQVVSPNNIARLVDEGGRATPEFQKFLNALAGIGATSVTGQLAALQVQIDQTDTNVASLSTTVAAHTTQLGNLPTSRLTGSAAYNPPNILAGGTTTTTVTVTGATLGMAADCSFSLDTAGVIFAAFVTSANTVTVILFNPTAGAINLGNGTLKAHAWNP